jgi:hypothetical protein
LNKFKNQIIKNYSDKFNKKYIIPENYILDETGFSYKESIIFSTIPFFIDSYIINTSFNIALDIIYFDDLQKKASFFIPFFQTGIKEPFIKSFRSKGIPIDYLNATHYIDFFTSFWNLNNQLLPYLESKESNDNF